MDQKEPPHPTPPSYSSVQHMGQDYPTKDGSGDPGQGYTYPQGYSNVPTQPQYQAYPPSGQQPMYPPAQGQPTYPSQQPMQPQYQQQPPPPQQANYVIVNQPQQVGMTVGMVTGEPKPPNHMCLAIIVCLCCNCPFGLLAIAFACKSDSAYAEGNHESARKSGRCALMLCIVGAVLSVVSGIMYTMMNWQSISHLF